MSNRPYTQSKQDDNYYRLIKIAKALYVMLVLKNREVRLSSFEVVLLEELASVLDDVQ